MFKRILIATDFTESSRAAWEVALELARAHQAELLVLHALLLLYYDVAYANLPEAYEEQRRATQMRLDGMAAEAAAAGVTVTTRIRRGRPAEEIAAAADEEKADLIVVGFHGQGGFNRLLIGSVAERVVRLAHCNVLTVQPPARRG